MQRLLKKNKRNFDVECLTEQLIFSKQYLEEKPFDCWNKMGIYSESIMMSVIEYLAKRVVDPELYLRSRSYDEIFKVTGLPKEFHEKYMARDICYEYWDKGVLFAPRTSAARRQPWPKRRRSSGPKPPGTRSPAEQR